MITPDFAKYPDGLVPAIIQDAETNKVLMLGFMNEEAFSKTRETKLVTFYSRSKKRIWTKGETSGNKITVNNILLDCDNDTILIKGIPNGPVCHTGSDTCFSETNHSFSLNKLENIIEDRKLNPQDSSHTSRLFQKGINKIAQKLGEEAVELVIESKDEDKDKFLNESADLLFHFLVLLHKKDQQLSDVVEVLARRNK
ncbi:MAG TPA: bifunctional phosphoribosyl-AMP cyclohydrolase/phosphoribosyl-ATP diphosphatase HisIE [Chitinophagaceae bacterium]|nr:bifunctional phosphoribosyl-AMP cyclohydrolase/phosphoribosyl-ATP diphosphatase HisIE [Chitinophagaceae bacterium]MCB9055899.1 bifunctional phosphoribosyl-AMP cyclohydrolase/phosphoribosyl-ATP diphosphatase HisIE [Chitinophagales bacterium]HPG10342.1 bifunctional phosphoribosyl-AMP cyclohydrolase/phosphoribosyl-ATP diphosphatase HisIE [Chitinophagaceae bacterium]HRX94712.1 bifunctional phosphoribosyl-AMP cyclohydrolase/phosphoribosyl-ATP diphosphatase HisIE [Chitinophagaceae bacterium]